MNVQRIDEHDHSQERVKIGQIIGKKRQEVAKEIVHEFNRCTKQFVRSQKASGQPTASEDVYRRCVAEYDARDDYTPDWSSNLIAVASEQQASYQGKHLNGYVQEIATFPFFKLFCFSEKQFECIKATSYVDRFLHIDSTGGLVSVPKDLTRNTVGEYSRILTYYCVMKNAQTLGRSDGAGSVLIGEMSSSVHHVGQIEDFFSRIRYAYQRINGSLSFNFRLVVIDMSWMLIHAVLDGFNRQTFQEYNQLVFSFAKDGDINSYNASSKTWLCSCAAHTMKRFSESIAPITTTYTYKYMLYLFSLLLNSTNLAMISEYFKLCCYILLSPTKTELVTRAESTIRELLLNRPTELAEVQRLIKRGLNRVQHANVLDLDEANGKI